jgi:hypothetical protein
VAAKYGHAEVRDLLTARSPSRVRLLNALVAADESAARAILTEDPALLSSLTPAEHGRLAFAIFHGLFASAALMLDLGFDPAAGGIDGGTALHAACWVGHVDLVERVLATGRVPVETRDPTHGSTPLGWTAFGAVHGRRADSDHAAVAARLVAAGADVSALGNRQHTLIQMATGNPAMQDALRRLGAT